MDFDSECGVGSAMGVHEDANKCFGINYPTNKG